jgi:formylglycine-generating enzyme required for sulfatase activity
MSVRKRTAGRALAATAILIVAALAPIAPASRQAAQPGELVVERIPGTEIEYALAFVPGGTFWLGSSVGDAGHQADEGPRREVRVRPFWMGIEEVTQAEFEIFRFRGLDDHIASRPEIAFDADGISRPSPPYEDPGHGLGDADHPAAGMTLRSALSYARWLSEKTGHLYRLPTEAEWEYACHAGGAEAYGFGADLTDIDGYAWSVDNSGNAHHPGGQKIANAWGLFDMHGNVAEWVMDTYSADAYSLLPQDEVAVDPLAGQPAHGRGVVRGGGFDDPPAHMRCAERLPELAAWKRRDPQIPKSRWWNTDSPHVGFRLVSSAHDFTQQEIRAYWDALLGPL